MLNQKLIVKLKLNNFCIVSSLLKLLLSTQESSRHFLVFNSFDKQQNLLIYLESLVIAFFDYMFMYIFKLKMIKFLKHS